MERSRTYILVYLALLLLLAVTVGVAYLNLGPINSLLALTIAIVKALFVILFFMNVRRSSGLIKLFAGAGFIWLAILISLTLSDYLTRTGGTIPGMNR